MIAMVIMCISAFSVFAQSTEEVNVKKLAYNLMQYAGQYDDTFLLRLEQNPGDLPLECDMESAGELIGLCEEVFDYYGEVCEGREPTVEEIDGYYTRLDTAAQKVVLSRSELKFIIDHCNNEITDNSYYPSELLKDFQDKLKTAVVVYDSAIEGIDVSYAYWNLKFAYNKLCVANSVSGDVDNSGDLNIFDVTLVQKSIANMYQFNSSQLTVLDKSAQEEVTIMEATKLQRCVADLEEFNSNSLNRLVTNTERMSLNDNRIFTRYRYYKYVGRI